MIRSTMSPHEAAERILAEAPSENWVRALADHLDRHSRFVPLERIQTSVRSSQLQRAARRASRWRRARTRPKHKGE